MTFSDQKRLYSANLSESQKDQTPMEKEKKDQAPVTKTSKRKCQYKFSIEERNNIGSEMTDHLTEIERLKADKKRTIKDFDSKISAEEALLDVSKNALQSGYEHRDVECVETMDSPKRGKKTVQRSDNGESWVEDMTFDEKNPPLPMAERPKELPPGQPLNPIDKAIQEAQAKKEESKSE